MTLTQTRDASSQTADVARVRLRVNVFDALMTAKGIKHVAAQAAALGVNRSTMFRLRAGETVPSLDLAMAMARAAETTVEALFEQVAA